MSNDLSPMKLMFQPLKKYASFSGRATRMEYWLFTLVCTILIMIPSFLGVILLVMGEEMREEALQVGGMIVIGIGVLMALGTFLPILAVSVRRLHDTNRSGWFYLLSVIPIVNYIGSIVLLVFYCLDGDPGPNQYGPDPKGRGEASLGKDIVDVFD